ncbi:MAG: type II toxin-antitoxin system VapC family toxin [Terracidiphilus sp.]|nr:type II toxin-antitoxin system VapC family toxin [Terracidiphilus sp.]MDR3799876.1 type II toxin-antitoxin system VapC family toxin [Terracidiphilus sp.]
MRLLLDTHVVLWWDADDSRLSALFRDAIASADSEVFVSAASAWEIGIKKASGKLQAGASVALTIRRHAFTALPVTVEHAEWAGSLPLLHRDPFDRLLVAQAQLEGLALVTVDEQILRYQVPHL